MITVLLIEDNTEIRENTVEILELEDYVVLVAKDGKAGLEMALITRPDIIICDIMMPLMNGYEVLCELRKNETTTKIPFVFVTATTEKKDIQLAMEMGATDYIQKPYEVDDLLNVLTRVLNGTER